MEIRYKGHSPMTFGSLLVKEVKNEDEIGFGRWFLLNTLGKGPRGDGKKFGS